MFLLRLLSRLRVFLALVIAMLIMGVLRGALTESQWLTYSPALLLIGAVLVVGLNTIRIRKR